jgi:prophage regulatory protein
MIKKKEIKSTRILKLPEVIRMSCLARSTIYLRMKEKTFPTPIKLGERSVGWIEEEIQDWINQQIEASRSSQPLSYLTESEFAPYDDERLIIDISGYHLVLNEVKSIIQAEPLGEDQKDSLLTKISSLEQSIKDALSNQMEVLLKEEEQEFQERREGRNNDNTS